MFDMPMDDDFEQLNELLSEYLRRAILDASKHFRERNYEREPHHFGGEWRVLLKKALKPLAEIYGFKILEIGGGSFCLVFKNYTYRIYKSSDGRVPPPDDTYASKSFYNANGKGWSIQHGFSGLGWEVPSLPPSDNISLIMYFGYTDVDGWHQLDWLKIACPRSATSSRVDSFWIKEVAITVNNENMSSFKSSTEERDDLSYTVREDVSISLEEIEERDDLSYTVQEDVINSLEESNKDSASIDSAKTEKRGDITYGLRDVNTTQEEAEEAEDTSNEKDNGTSTRQIE